MSRNAMDACINAANERDDQRETALREWRDSVAPRARMDEAAPDMLDALTCAYTVLILLKDEVSGLGHSAEKVLEKVSAAIKKANG